MMNQPSPDSSSQEDAAAIAKPIAPTLGWLDIVAVVGIVFILMALLMPAIQSAREAARKTQSRNNLKQWGLAFHNYHDTYGRFPVGADIQADGTAMHGWCSRLIPYLEASDWYSRLDQNRSWNHAANAPLHYEGPRNGSIPGQPEQTSSGVYLMHYMGNPNVLHRNSSVCIQDFTKGTTNSWLIGEVNNVYQPLMYPCNWRSLTWPVNGGVGSYGGRSDGGMFCMCDGSVRDLPNSTARSIIESLAVTPSVADPEQIAVPPICFPVADGVMTKKSLEAAPATESDKKWSRPFWSILIDEHGTPQVADFRSGGKGGRWNITPEDLKILADQYPGLQKLMVSEITLTSEYVHQFSRFRELDTLIVRSVQLSDQEIHTLPQVQHLVLTSAQDTSPETKDSLLRHSPNCKIEF
ncbi:MAG: DUF1559 domain-containing protein [Planctomycetaceae bacterium]|nr:DUF1559 domain-containing protein [Planctomycetaceae bacterium]